MEEITSKISDLSEKLEELNDDIGKLQWKRRDLEHQLNFLKEKKDALASPMKNEKNFLAELKVLESLINQDFVDDACIWITYHDGELKDECSNVVEYSISISTQLQRYGDTALSVMISVKTTNPYVEKIIRSKFKEGGWNNGNPEIIQVKSPP